MKKIVLTGLALLIFAIVQSHEFWMQTKKFRYKIGEEMKVEFMVGENFEGEPWDLKKHRVEKLNMYHLAKVIDLKKSVMPDQKDRLKFKFTEVGTHLLTMESNTAYIELDAAKFNDYLKEDGLDNVLDIRTKSNTLDKPSKEFYSRHVKLLVQSGDKTDDTFKKKIGMRVEIIPSQNPYNLKTGEYLQCLVLFDGKPLPHQMVKIWNKIGDNSILQNAYTESDGTIKFPISSKGPWMISTVRMIASEKPEADWQSFWASLVFGIE
ncbi:hypothetical protein WSM22_22110 [Cytophagales bacterium WSM2-2]|nr:hypothetical protein WSM22_22110 [Cytophagales bacterium WSM2-2]